jgi:hypothetical protein
MGRQTGLPEINTRVAVSLGVTPASFELPPSGGMQVIGGGVDAGGGDGFFDSGSLLVSRQKQE